jgi:predicted nucleic acid-binding protein
MRTVVVDTGPLVAYFDRDDHDHPGVHAWFATRASKHRLLTTEAVVTEVTHLLDFNVAVQTAFLAWAARAIVVAPVPQAVYRELSTWMSGSANVPMDFADATVLWLYRETRDAQILTLDQRGFGVFRLPGQGKKRPAVVVL